MKERNSQTPSTEIASLARTLFIIIALIVGVLLMGVAFWIDVNPKVRDPSVVEWQFAIGQQILIAIGTSILASILFYLLYSRTAEERVLREVSTQVTLMATEYATSLFQQRFNKMMPTKIYPETGVPSREFNDDFDEILQKSMIYKYKGDAASYTTFRLHMLCQKGNLLDKEIKLLLLDPRELQLFEDRAQVELTKRPSSKAELTSYANELRQKVYVTLVALFDISHSSRIEVAFHKEHPFFRSEIFEEGIFLTYYLGGEFPSTYLYSRDTVSYNALLLNFWQNYNASKDHIVFNDQLTEATLRSVLDSLGCTDSIEELRRKKEEGFKIHKELTLLKH